MKFSYKLLAASAACVAAVWTSGFAAQPQGRAPAQAETDLCRRAPTAIALPPEPREQVQRRTPTGRYRGGAYDGVMPPPPPPPPPPSVAPMAPESRAAPPATMARPSMPPSADAPTSDAMASAPVEGRIAPDRGSAFAPRDRGPRQPEPQAGLLTAGDHDDLLNAGIYARYVEDFLSAESLVGVPRVDTRGVLTIQVRDRANNAVPFANVTLTCADGNRLTLATTANGEAVFFPELDRLGRSVSVAVSSGGQTTQGPRAVSFTRGQVQRQTVTIGGAAPAVRAYDLALVVDTTGSMSDELTFLQAELDNILASLRRSHPGLDIRIALIVYRDEGDEYVTRTFPFTRSVVEMQARLAQQRADGGGDTPEAVEQALARAVALDWRPNAVRSLVFVADAPPHADDVAASWRSAEVARARRIHIVPVGASGVDRGAEYMMRAMAAATQSRYIFLTDDSGIGNPHAEPSVDCYLVTALNPLIRRVLDSQISGRRVEPQQGEIIRTVGNYDRGRCVGAPQ